MARMRYILRMTSDASSSVKSGSVEENTMSSAYHVYISPDYRATASGASLAARIAMLASIGLIAG